MAKQYEVITPKIREFIEQQKMFFVATAPLAADGHVNVSPKGLDSLRVIDDTTVAYLDMVGSGIETVSHLKENGRMVLMFCAFEGSPLIVRLHGQGEAIEKGDPRYEELAKLFPPNDGARSVIVLRATRITDSCGWTVPLYAHDGERDYHQNYTSKLGPEGIREAKQRGNLASIDGLEGLTADLI